MSEPTVTYLCGCDGGEVGQAFDHGLLVCPVHHEPVAPFERPPQPHRYRLELFVDLEVDHPQAARAFAASLSESLIRDGKVVGVFDSLVEKTLGGEVPA